MNNRNTRPQPKKLARYMFGLLLLQGLSFVLLGFLVLIYPVSIIWLVATALFWLGLTTMIAAFRWQAHSKTDQPAEAFV